MIENTYLHPCKAGATFILYCTVQVGWAFEGKKVCFLDMILLVLLLVAAVAVGNARKDIPVFGSGDLVATASALSSSSTRGTSTRDASRDKSDKSATKKGILKGFGHGAKGKREQAGPSVSASTTATSSSTTTSAIQNTPLKTSIIMSKGRNNSKRHGISNIGINTDLFLTEFNLQNLALSILSGGGVYIGFRLAGILESLYHRYVRKQGKETNNKVDQSQSNGKNRVKNPSEGNMNMYNELKSEQEELWRITHKLYSEVERVGSVSNSTRVDLVEVLDKLAQVQSSSGDENVHGKGTRENILSMKREVDDNTEKINNMTEALATLVNEDIPSMLKVKEKAIVEKVAGYVKELKELVNTKQKSQRGRTSDGSSSSSKQN